jgi:hypothetical protein
MLNFAVEGEDQAPPSICRPVVLFDLIADDAAYCRAADYADRAAAGQYAAGNCADAGADGGIFILRAHAGASRHAKYCGDQHSVHRGFFARVHLDSLLGSLNVQSATLKSIAAGWTIALTSNACRS